MARATAAARAPQPRRGRRARRREESAERRASPGPRRPAGSGRARVRNISASVSRSITWLRTLAPAATRPVPTSAAASRRPRRGRRRRGDEADERGEHDHRRDAGLRQLEPVGGARPRQGDGLGSHALQAVYRPGAGGASTAGSGGGGVGVSAREGGPRQRVRDHGAVAQAENEEAAGDQRSGADLGRGLQAAGRLAGPGVKATISFSRQATRR